MADLDLKRMKYSVAFSKDRNCNLKKWKLTFGDNWMTIQKNLSEIFHFGVIILDNIVEYVVVLFSSRNVQSQVYQNFRNFNFYW